jgi:hypothetical protein
MVKERGMGEDLKACEHRKAGVWDIFAVALLLLAYFIINRWVFGLWWLYDDPWLLKSVIETRWIDWFLSHKVWVSAFSPANLTPWLPLSLKADLSLAGLHASFFHIHQFFSLSVALVLLYVFLRLFLPVPGAFLGGLIFLCGTPTKVVAHMLMTRHYVEGLVFALASMVFWFQGYRKKKRVLVLLSAVFYLLSVTAKELYAPLPLVLMCWPEGDLRDRLRKLFPLFGILIAYFLWRRWMLGSFVGGYARGGSTYYHFSPLDVALFPKRVLERMIPLRLWEWVFSFAGLVVAAMGFWKAGKEGRLAPFSLFAGSLLVAALGPILPVSSIMTYRYTLVAWVAFSCCLAAGFKVFGKAGQWIWLMVLLVLVVGAFEGGRECIGDLKRGTKQWEAEGHFIFSHPDSGEDVLLTPIPHYPYYKGLRWIRTHYLGRPSGPRATCSKDRVGAVAFSVLSKKERGLWRYNPAKGRVERCWEKVAWKEQAAPSHRLQVSIVRKAGEIKWKLGPYKKGDYGAIVGNQVYAISRKGSSQDIFGSRPVAVRILYVSRGSWYVISPPLTLRREGEVKWPER